MNPFRRFLDFISYPSHSRTIGFLAFLVVLLTVPLTVNIAQKQQELRQRAAGTTQCDQNGGYCDNGQCAKLVSHCLVDTTLPSNCTNQGADCTSPDGQTSHVYQCSELQPDSCATPSAPPTKPACSGTCESVQTCHQIDNGTVDTNQACSGSTVCCVVGNGCVQKGGQCVDQGYYQQHQNEGSIISATCYSGDLVCFKPGTGGGTTTLSPDQAAIKACQDIGGTCLDNGKCILGPNSYAAVTCPIKPGSGGTCKTDAASAVGCNVGCVTQGGQNMKCHVQNRDTGGTCSSSCTSGGPWNCVIDNAVCPQPTSGGAGTGGGTTCDASKGFIAPCTNPGAIEDNATPCKLADGSTGKSVKQCQGACWYDSYYDTSAAKAPQSQWCYPTGVKLAFTVGLDGIGSTGDQKNPKPDPISNQSRGSNKSPKHNQRSITVEAIASDGTKTSANGTITYNSTGKYDASVTFDKLAQGVYTFKVKGDIYLKKTIATAIGVSSGQTVTLPAVNLVTGDMDKDNRLSVGDYNFFSPGNCLFKSPTGSCASADLDDDGIIDQYDYNLFIREFAVVQDGD